MDMNNNVFISDENIPEEVVTYQGEIIDEEKLINEVKEKHRQPGTKFNDIITMQCIVCILLAIAFVTLNIALPKISSDIVTKYKSESVYDKQVNDVLVSIVSKISDFMNTSPNDRI